MKSSRTGRTPTSAKRLTSSRENASYGGQERACRYHDEILSEWSSRGGNAVLAKYGREYFTALRKRRKNYPKYSESPVIQTSPRVLAGRTNGRQGGIRRAELYSAESLQAMARQGGIATRTRHGNEFFRTIRKLRKYYVKGYFTRKTKERLREEALNRAGTEKDWAIAALWGAVARNWEP